jgi:hypothetical protein
MIEATDQEEEAGQHTDGDAGQDVDEDDSCGGERGEHELAPVGPPQAHELPRHHRTRDGVDDNGGGPLRAGS